MVISIDVSKKKDPTDEEIIEYYLEQPKCDSIQEEEQESET